MNETQKVEYIEYAGDLKVPVGRSAKPYNDPDGCRASFSHELAARLVVMQGQPRYSYNDGYHAHAIGSIVSNPKTLNGYRPDAAVAIAFRKCEEALALRLDYEIWQKLAGGAVDERANFAFVGPLTPRDKIDPRRHELVVVGQKYLDEKSGELRPMIGDEPVFLFRDPEGKDDSIFIFREEAEGQPDGVHRRFILDDNPQNRLLGGYGDEPAIVAIAGYSQKLVFSHHLKFEEKL